jgi:uncharacterized protein with HEPN domain
MLEAIGDIRLLLNGKNITNLGDRRDVVTRAAFERFLEIGSEASRHVSDDRKNEFGPLIDWRGVADIGNLLRHEYDRLSLEKLWEIYESDLDPLQRALDRMAASYLAANPNS